MKKLILMFIAFIGLCVSLSVQCTYLFQDTNLSDDERIDNLLSLMTIDEKVSALGTDLGVPRLEIMSTGHSEGLHGMVLGGPGGWGGKHIVNNRIVPIVYPTTIFPQAYG